MCNTKCGGFGPAIVLVLFILLIIIVGAAAGNGFY